MSTLILFEPANLASFAPLTYLRSVAELRYGIYSNLERTIELYGQNSDVQLWIRPILAKDHEERHPNLSINQTSNKDTLFLNASIPAWLFPKIMSLMENEQNLSLYKDGILIAAKSAQKIQYSSNFHHDLQKLKHAELDDDQLDNLPIWIWDYLDLISEAIEFDMELWKSENQYLPKINAGISTLGEKDIFIHNTAQISNFVHMDASQGPIIIDADCQIGPFCSLEGPLYIGKRSSLKPSTSIRHTTVGRVCNLGGEIKGSIIHPYSNKSHSGYLGDSILGSWINLGAGTNNSNLKNNYQPIRVSWDGNNYDTDRQFLGAIIGDHSKTAIGVRINTGTLIGPFSNVIHNDFPPRAIPSFSWGNGTHDLDKAILTTKKVMGRRGLQLSSVHEELIIALADDIQPFTHF
jgi:UDP-N-acetylglucosamine diphosphorylase/glucosamine-1-phosphate N-acetyltransferase